MSHQIYTGWSVRCSEAMPHTYSNAEAGSSVMQQCNVVSKRPTVAASSTWDGLTDTMKLLTCHQLSLNMAHGEDRIQCEQVSTISGTKYNSWVVRTCEILNYDDIHKKIVPKHMTEWNLSQKFILLGDAQKKPSLERCWWSWWWSRWSTPEVSNFPSCRSASASPSVLFFDSWNTYETEVNLFNVEVSHWYVFSYLTFQMLLKMYLVTGQTTEKAGSALTRLTCIWEVLRHWLSWSFSWISSVFLLVSFKCVPASV